MKYIPLILLFLLSGQVYAEEKMEFSEVADGIYMFEGTMEEMFSSEKGMVANVTFIVGTEAVAVIDTGSSYRQGQLIFQAIRSRTPLPVKYVINTHVHLDHIFGNRAFVGEKPQFVVHEKFPRALAARGQYYRDRLEGSWYEGTEVVQATRLISRVETIDLGDRGLILTPHGPAHTNNDLTVFDKNTGTLVAGDLVFVDHLPVLDGSINGWLEEIATLEKAEFSFLIPGHGPVQRDKSSIGKIKDYLTTLRGEVRKAIAEQMDLEEASNSLLAEQAPHWKLFDEFHKRNVIAAYTELEWE